MRTRPSILVFSIRYDYTVPVTTAAYTQLHASLPEDVTQIEVFDSSGQTMQLAYGPAAGEKVLGDIMPGGNTVPISTVLSKGMRLAVKAISANATSGELTLNFYL